MLAFCLFVRLFICFVVIFVDISVVLSMDPLSIVIHVDSVLVLILCLPFVTKCTQFSCDVHYFCFCCLLLLFFSLTFD